MNHTENFKYCDAPTIEEESKSAFIDRCTDSSMQIKLIENAWILPCCKEFENIQGEVLDENGYVVPNVCSATIYSQQSCSVKYSLPPEYECSDAVIYRWHKYVLGTLYYRWH